MQAFDAHAEHDKGHGRIEERRTAVLYETDWLAGPRRFPGELRLPGAACLVRAETRVVQAGRTGTETRYVISSRALAPKDATKAVPRHWAIENRLHRVLDVAIGDDLSRLRKGFGAQNMSTVRHFALNLVRVTNDKRSIKSRRKRAGWASDYLQTVHASPARLFGFGALVRDGGCRDGDLENLKFS